jgi:hypothetical protein
MCAEYPCRIDERTDSGALSNQTVKPKPDERVSFVCLWQKEGAMSRISRTRLLFATIAATLLSAGHACASQGPGIPPGTASASLQLTMAIAVYGLCAAALTAGVIGAFRKS